MALSRILMTMAAGVCLAAPVQAQAPAVGDAIANPAVLARLFAAACLQSETLHDAQTMLANAGMVPNPDTGTYFHQRFDMSVNPSGDLCSMVFSGASEAEASDVFRQSVVQVVGEEAGEVEIVRINDVSDLYLRASIEGRW